MFRTIYRERFQIRRGKILQWSTENLKTKSSNLFFFSIFKRRQNLVVKNIHIMIESSNSATRFRTIYRERFQIRRGKILQCSTKNSKTKSSSLILFNFQEEAKFSGEKHIQNVFESSNSTTMFRTIYRERFQIRRGKILQCSAENSKTKSSNLIFFSIFKRRQNLVVKNTLND